ncbi:MAG: transporter [Lachnospiraceae bacterium]|nr:transporter [Lachnospiraceae bacterium]
MKKVSWKIIAFLQIAVMIYTLSSVAAKLAAGEEAFSIPFLLLYGLQILMLGVYALAWQQIIKRCDLSVAYANRSMAILWSLIWTVLFFHETLSVKNVMGVLIVFAGTMMVNSDGE